MEPTTPDDTERPGEVLNDTEQEEPNLDEMSRRERRAWNRANQLRLADQSAENRRAALEDWDKQGQGSRELIRVALSELKVDPDYQRDLRPNWVKTIVRNFDPELLRELEVNVRADGSVWVVDGQHRLAALRQIARDPSSFEVICLVSKRESQAHESKMFTARNTDILKLAKTQTFHSRLTAGDPATIAVRDMIKASGFIPVMRPMTAVQPGRISTGAVEQIIKSWGKIVTQEVMEVLYEGYGNEYGIPTRFVMGVASFYGRYRHDPNFRRERLIRLFADNSPRAFVAKGDYHHKHAMVTTTQGISMALHRAYNHKLRYKLAPVNLDALDEEALDERLSA